ncbi:hypothetical protein PIB30_050585 [Stylosanthes scabra]|uniref:Uncharacterized protein n=1 Tax=Stylosanthes scabra TaxID=79078 RepID=A0ABU6UH31_9FABA|nr:hypothetical protein [Stylosanthes scabra]
MPFIALAKQPDRYSPPASEIFQQQQSENHKLMGFPVQNKRPKLNSNIYRILRVITQESFPTDPVLAPDDHRSYFPGGPISRPQSLVVGTMAGGPPATTKRYNSNIPSYFTFYRNHDRTFRDENKRR